MDNLNELQKSLLLGAPSVDDYLGHVGTGDFIRDVIEIRKEETFTKLEKAALMIAQGFAANANTADDITVIPKLSKSAVLFAKAVLEEANK